MDPMKIRHATVHDARTICDLVNALAEEGLMLHRSLEDIFDSIREFLVAVDEDTLLGCVAVDVFWGGLAEIRSLAVAPEARGRGVGGALVEAAVNDAYRLGIKNVFALTYEKPFFERRGFHVVDLKALPEKVWRECLHWYAKGYRHETAMLRELETEGYVPPERPAEILDETD
jgi:amino-acid N-acetyltransferase